MHPARTRGLGDLPGYWRSEAANLCEWGMGAEATVLERDSTELEAALVEETNETLTPTEAARRTGYSAEHLVRQGKLRNAGRKHAPRVRRGALTSRSGRGLTST